MHRQGTYWFAAFFHYITPIIPFLGFVFIYFRKQNCTYTKLDIAAMSLLLFLSAYSQELWALTTLLFTLAILIKAIIDKSYRHYYLAFLAASITGFLLLFLCPAIANRAQKAATDMPLLAEIFSNIKRVLKSFFGWEHQSYFIVMYGALAVISIADLCKVKRIFGKIWDMFCCCIFLIFSYMLAFKYFDVIDFWHSYEDLCLISCVLLVIIISIQVTRMYLRNQDYVKITIYYTAIVSISALSVLHEQPIRLMLIPYMLFFIFMADGYLLIRNIKFNSIQNLMTIIICLTIAGTAYQNGHAIYSGYKSNYQILSYNDYVLKQASNEIKKGDTVNHIYVQKIKDVLYGSDMFYEPSASFAKVWVDNYYLIPHSVEIIFTEDFPDCTFD